MVEKQKEIKNVPLQLNCGECGSKKMQLVELKETEEQVLFLFICMHCGKTNPLTVNLNSCISGKPKENKEKGVSYCG